MTITTGKDTARTRSTLQAGGASYAYFSIEAAEKAGLGSFARLPAVLKVVLENLLRFEDGRTVTTDDIRAFADWADEGGRPREIAYRPARVLMQDFTGVPAVVDLAAMRDGIKALGGDPQRINPLIPVDLVIDHSVMVTSSAIPAPSQLNVEREYERNSERYQFLKWGQKAFDNFRVVPPGTGICHQVNLEYSGPDRVDRYRPGPAHRGRLSRHAGGHRQPHHHGQRAGGAGLGRGRHRGRSGDAGPARVDADPRGDRLQAHRPAARGRHRHRPGADGHADAAQEGRGRQVRRILRPRA
ncbi:MAG: hypothetical protein KatS3mg118_1538 [Paracoccaceae bacterium]|nr:MAG: hypothetical protein KatS3mg118_1538 [Paracoccaceae bacterium]